MKRLIVSLLFFISISCSQNEVTENNITNKEDKFWEQTNKIDKRVDVIYIDQNDNILVAAAYGHLYRSTDNGNSWNFINPDLTNKINNIYSVAVNSKGYIYISTGQIYRSIDNGLTWSEVSKSGVRFNYMLIDMNDKIYGLTSGQMFCSSNDGNSWEASDITLEYFSPHSFIINSKGDLIAAGMEGTYLSTDKGKTWTKIKEGYCYTIAVNRNDEIFTITGYSMDKAIYKSINNGATWERIKNVTATEIIINGKNYIYGINGTIGMVCSTDGGKNWTEINKGLSPLFVHAIALNSNGFIFAGTADYDNYNNLVKGEVFKSIKSTLE